MAAIPSAALVGVHRVVISCDQVSGLSEVEQRQFCDQLVRKAGALTDIPVFLASANDFDASNLAGRADQLMLHVKASATAIDATRKAVTMQVAALRPARPIASRTSPASSISFVKVQNAWVLQGPVDPFIEVLAGTRGVHLPAVSDN
jgi:hypothetical protein